MILGGDCSKPEAEDLPFGELPTLGAALRAGGTPLGDGADPGARGNHQVTLPVEHGLAVFIAGTEVMLRG